MSIQDSRRGLSRCLLPLLVLLPSVASFPLPVVTDTPGASGTEIFPHPYTLLGDRGDAEANGDRHTGIISLCNIYLPISTIRKTLR